MLLPALIETSTGHKSVKFRKPPRRHRPPAQALPDARFQTPYLRPFPPPSPPRSYSAQARLAFKQGVESSILSAPAPTDDFRAAICLPYRYGKQESRHLRRPAAPLVARTGTPRSSPTDASPADDLAEHCPSRWAPASGGRGRALGSRQVLPHKRPWYPKEPQPGREPDVRALDGAPRPRPARRGPRGEGDRPGNPSAASSTVCGPGLARPRR